MKKDFKLTILLVHMVDRFDDYLNIDSVMMVDIVRHCEARKLVAAAALAVLRMALDIGLDKDLKKNKEGKV